MWPTTSHADSSCGSLRTGVRRSTATSSTTRAGVTSHRPFRRWSRRSGCDLEIPDPRLRRRLQLPAPGRLATEQQALRILCLSADLEGAEILVPGAVGSSASVPECEAGELLLELFLFDTILGQRQAIGKPEEPIALGILRLEARFDQLGNDSAGARLLDSGQRPNASRDTCRE